MIVGTTLLLILGVGPAAVGMAGGMALQGMLFAPSDLMMYTVNLSTLLFPLFAIHELAKRIIPADKAYVDLGYGDVLKLSLAFQGGIVLWVAFWVFYGQGFAVWSDVASFGAAYMLVVLIEPLVDLGALALAKTLDRFSTAASSSIACITRRRDAPHQISVHDPAVARPRRGSFLDDARARFGQRPGVEHLLGHAQIGAPPDIDTLRIEMLKRAGAVQHDDHRVGRARPALGAQPAPGGDRDGAVDAVERDGMRGGQRLQRGDPGQHAQPGHRIEPRGDAQGRIVKPGSPQTSSATGHRAAPPQSSSAQISAISSCHRATRAA